MNKLLLVLASLLILSSCGELTGKETGANKLTEDILSGGISFIELGDNKILLEGTMNKGDAHSFNLKFRLPEGKSLRYFFFSKRNLEGGVSVTFSRQDSELSVNIELNGVSDTRVLTEIGEVVDVVIDIHNDHEDAHILLWDKSSSFGDEEECVDDGSCLYNTEYYTFPNDGPWGSQGRAPGTFWGVQGDRSLIIQHEGPLGAVSDA